MQSIEEFFWLKVRNTEVIFATTFAKSVSPDKTYGQLMGLIDAKDTLAILINIDILINSYQIVPILKRNLTFLLFYS